MKAPATAGLTVKVTADYQELSSAAARIIIEELRRKPDLLLCASAGSTPRGTYRALARQYQRQPALFRKMRVLQIDEWGGLQAGGAGTCVADLREQLLEPLKIDRARCHVLRSEAKAPRKECERAANWLARNGPIDLCLLGLGLNGHVAMNEPGAELLPSAHVAKLARTSSHHPMLKEAAHKPRYGLTLGLGEILCSRQILLLVSGPHKRAILKRVLQPRVTTQVPASFLWLHSAATVLCDRAALGRSSMR